MRFICTCSDNHVTKISTKHKQKFIQPYLSRVVNNVHEKLGISSPIGCQIQNKKLIKMQA